MSSTSENTDQAAAPGNAPDWTRRLARNKRGIALLSFGESTFVPIPLESILTPLMLSYRRSAMMLATASLIGCIAGSLVLFLLGWALFEPVVKPLLDQFGLTQDFQDMQSRLEGSNLFWTVFLISLSPAPVQLASIGAGTAGSNIVVFAAAISLSRGIRYYGLAAAALLLGEKIEEYEIPTGKLIIALLAIAIVAAVVPMFLGG